MRFSVPALQPFFGFQRWGTLQVQLQCRVPCHPYNSESLFVLFFDKAVLADEINGLETRIHYYKPLCWV